MRIVLLSMILYYFYEQSSLQVSWQKKMLFVLHCGTATVFAAIRADVQLVFRTAASCVESFMLYISALY